MSSPCGDDVRVFAREFFRDQVVSLSALPSINVHEAFTNYLVERGNSRLLSDEFSERNMSNLLDLVQKRADEWIALDLNSPIHIVENGPQVITWSHPKFVDVSGRNPISSDFCSILNILRNCKPREFLGYAACYLHAIGCDKIFITDASGDAGIDLLGVFNQGPFRNVCIFVQSKTTNATSMINKETLLCDYSKYLLLRKLDRWNDYCQSSGLLNSIDGMGCVFMFLSNSEFKEGLRTAAVGLEVLLRSGRQIASTISEVANLESIQQAIEAIQPFNASITKNLAKTLDQYLKS